MDARETKDQGKADRARLVGPIEVVYSFDEAIRRDREAMWAMTPNERMELLEILRQQWTANNETEPAFPGVLEVSRSTW